MPCQRCTVVLFDFERGQAQLIAGFAGGSHLDSAPVPLSEFSAEELLQSGAVRYIEDLTTVEDPPPMYRQLLAEGHRSVLSVPLLVEGDAIGELNLASATPAGFDAEHRDIALEVATPLAIAIQQARLREELARQRVELERRLADRGTELRAAAAELETLLYSVSHDLRGPLRQMIGFSRLLLDESSGKLDPAGVTLRHTDQRGGGPDGHPG